MIGVCSRHLPEYTSFAAVDDRFGGYNEVTFEEAIIFDVMKT